MDLSRLSEFMIIAEAGSLKEAAMHLGLPLSVLSTRLSSFENALGAELFTRDAHHLALTKSGTVLLQNAKAILDSYERSLLSLRSVQNVSFRSLRIMLCAQTMAAELGPFLDHYCRHYPKMFLGIYDENACYIRSGLQSGEIDIAFAIGREGDFLDITGREILDELPRMKVHVPNDHPLAKSHHIRFEALAGETFILYPRMRETHTRDLQLSMLEQAGIEYQIYEEDYSPFFYDLLVPIGKGVRLWNWNYRLAPNSKLLTIDDAGYETKLYMLYDKNSENAAVPHFIDRYMAFRRERI